MNAACCVVPGWQGELDYSMLNRCATHINTCPGVEMQEEELRKPNGVHASPSRSPERCTSINAGRRAVSTSTPHHLLQYQVLISLHMACATLKNMQQQPTVEHPAILGRMRRLCPGQPCGRSPPHPVMAFTVVKHTCIIKNARRSAPSRRWPTVTFEARTATRFQSSPYKSDKPLVAHYSFPSSNTQAETDPIYVCPSCLRKSFHTPRNNDWLRDLRAASPHQPVQLFHKLCCKADSGFLAVSRLQLPHAIQLEHHHTAVDAEG